MESNENKIKNTNVETYTNDMVSAIESDRSGLIKKIIHEEEEHETEKSNLSPNSKKNRLFMLVSMFLIVLAFAILFFLAFFNERINTVVVQPQASSVVFTEQNSFKEIDTLTKEKIIETILNEVNNPKTKISTMEGIHLLEGKKVVGLKRFMTLLKSSLVFDQNVLFGENFLLGSYKSGLSSISPNSSDFFMLLKVSSFTDVFSVMKNWEKKMLYDLYGFFNVKVSSETDYLFTKNFEDGIVSNKNARILKDNNGNIILMYVFIDDSSILVTNSEATTNEVVLRMTSSKIKK